MKRRILVVEDNEPFLETLVFFLEQKGHEVFPANSVARALDELKWHEFSIVVTDLRLGNERGEEIINFFASSDGPKTKVIAMTAYANEIELARILSRAAALLVKPFPLDDLATEIERHTS